MDEIPWDEPSELTLNDCPNIDGTYSPFPIGGKHSDDNFLRLFEYPKRIIKTDVINMREQSENPEEKEQIYRSQLIDFRIKNNILTKTRLNKSGKLYSIKTILLDSYIRPEEWQRGIEGRAGCHNGKYIYRTVDSGGGIKRAVKARSWCEQQIEKLPNGDLKVRRFRMKALGSGEREVTEKNTYVFPAYRP